MRSLPYPVHYPPSGIPILIALSVSAFIFDKVNPKLESVTVKTWDKVRDRFESVEYT